jgi:hypothetical protein
MRAKQKGSTRASLSSGLTRGSRATASAAGRHPRITPAPGLDPGVGGRLRPNGGRQKHTGQQADDCNEGVASAARQALSVRHAETWTRVAPGDETERMIAAQLSASHAAAMACYRSAMAGPPDARRWHADLSQACRLTRTFAQLVDALARRRRNAGPKITVLHLHVHAPGAGAGGAGPLARPALPAPAKSAE